MKKITLLFLLFVTGWQINAQSTCIQTFTVTGDDDGPTILTINSADVTCNGANPATSIKLINADESLVSGFCSDWFSFSLSIDGATPITGCGADFNNIDITGFSTLTITSSDDDAYQDTVTIAIDVEATYTPSSAPNCTALNSPANGASDVSSSQISWPAAGTASGYKLKAGTTPGGTDILNMQDVGNVLTYNLGALTPGGTFYVTVIPYNAIGDAVACTETSFSTCLICYCVPTITYGCTDGDVIARVTLNTLDNNSGTGCPSGLSGYSNYTADPNPLLTTTLQAGGSYSCTVFAGEYSEGYAAWIDYNDDGTFDNATERIGYSAGQVTGSGNPGDLGSSATFPIVLACNPSLGQHRLRVRAMFNTNGSAVTPCTNNAYGEVEDYTITISAAVACPQPSALAATNITSTSASLSWNTGCAETVWDLYITPAGSPAPGSPTNVAVVSPFVVTGLTPETDYEFYVRADCGPDGTSLWTGPYLFTTVVTPPANENCIDAIALTPGGVFGDQSTPATIFGATTTPGVTPSCQTDFGSDVWYSVVVPASGSITIETQQAANDTMTDSLIAAFAGSCGTLTEIDCNEDKDTAGGDFMSLLSLTGRTPGELIYIAVWKFEAANPASSESNFLISAYDASLTATSFDINGFAAYPNPVKDVLNLSYTKDISNVSVHNLLGQEVMTKSINSAQTKIDLSNLSRGTYLVKVIIDDLVKIIKIVKE